MTLPYERTNAVLQTEKFLINLTNPKVYPGVPKVVREHARALLRHYPTASHIDLTVKMCNDKLMAFTFECPFAEPGDKP